MNDFSYFKAGSIPQVLTSLEFNPHQKLIGGGTNLLDLMKEDVVRTDHVTDVNHLKLNRIEEIEEGALRLGATVTNADTAYHPLVKERYPLLSKAILAGASPQIRNMATTAGNLLQRTRCYYFYDTATACNKRSPEEGCAALHGVNKIHAILGASEHCIAVHPSDMCVALSALEAVVQVTSTRGTRSIPFANFHLLPGDTPHIETDLQPDELITAVDLPKKGFPRYYSYIKARERNSYAFALASAAVGLDINDEGVISDARISMGGVAHKPWRSLEAEYFLLGKKPSKEVFEGAAEVFLEGARGYGHNNFKIILAKRVIVRALETACNEGEEL